MVSRADFPGDDDGEVLFQLASKGVDLSQKRLIEFSAYAVDVDAAKHIVSDLASYGYDAKVFVDNGDGGTGDVSVYAGIFMVPDHRLLLIEPERLNAILRFHSTKCDGWMTASQPHGT